MKTLSAWLIIRNGMELRLLTRKPFLQPNEVAVEIRINAPQPPRIVGVVTIDLPEPPPATAEAVAIQYPEEYHNDGSTSGEVQRSGLSGSEEAGEQGSEEARSP